MRTIKTVIAMQRAALQSRRCADRVALVPTMGYLHAGHASLIRRARKAVGPNGRVVVSIYVNPAQFGPGEDLAAYPRDLKRDLKMCRELGVDILFLPNDREVYPGKESGEFSTFICEELLSQRMEGASRPVHFRGVGTVVAKLFNIVLPEVAVFGAKDWQQAALIRRMVKDLNFSVKIIVAPTVREADGLAMSSRNAYLTSEERQQATVLIESIRLARREIGSASEGVPATKLKRLIEKQVAAKSRARLDYVEFFHSDSLKPVKRISKGTHMALAVFFDKARLIDNGRI